MYRCVHIVLYRIPYWYRCFIASLLALLYEIVLYEFQSTILVIASLYGQSLLFMVKDIGEKGPEDALFPMSVAKTLMVKIIQIFF